jgi:serine/threonine protein kinase
MSPDDLVDRVANDLADGRPIDWDAVLASARSDDEREQVESLRLVHRMIQEHRSGDHPANGNPGRQDIAPAPDVVLPAEGEWGRFRLLEKVGAGSFGSVYRAFDPDLDREIAIKILHRSVDDSLLKERLLKEGRALAKVRHTNVVNVLGVEFYGDQVGLCMEFIRGETLETEIGTRGTFSESQTVEIGKAICQALSAVHRAGFVHRDVKARNIMRERDTGRIVLMDFGTGREIDELTSGAIGIAGTAIYMAPEVLARQPASPCSDVYSVGVLLYYLLTAKYPVEGHSREELEAAHMAGLRTPLSDRRPDLKAPFVLVVERALAANRQQRHSTPGALFEELEKVTIRPWSAWQKYFTIVGSALIATILGLIGLGVVNTRYFNAALGRSEYVNETISDWFYWGAVSSVAPIVLSIFAVAALALTVVCKRIVTAASPRARAFEKAVLDSAHKWRLDDVSNLSSCVLLVSASVLIVTWWSFAPLIGALISASDPDISTAPLESLSFLSPRFRPYHENYRLSFIWVTIASCMLWYPAVKLAVRRGESVIRPVFAGGVAILILSLLLLDFPWRFIYRREFEVATWQGHHCYVIGERADDFLLFCPQISVPRNRRVSKRATDLELAGVKENIFSLLSPDGDRRP